MGIKLAAASGGSIELVPTNTASNYTVTVPAGTGTIVVSGASSAITSGTAVASTSGTSIDFTSIPSWVKRITVMFNGVSTSGSSPVQVQIGSATFVTTGYVGSCNVSTTNTNYSSGFVVHANLVAATVASGVSVLVTPSANIWVQSGTTASASNANTTGAGILSLGGTLDRVRITTVNGTDTFDAGSINILWE